MKALVNVTPTPEQLPIISNPRAGVTLIRGAAGSGKTTTALLMLKQLAEFWIRNKERKNDPSPIRILVLTFNRTLRGYISHLAENQIESSDKIKIGITTFGKWSTNLTGCQNIIDTYERDKLLLGYAFANDFSFNDDFLCDEVDYCLGRFEPSKLGDYLIATRHGRGRSPKIERNLRGKLLKEIIQPYNEYKHNNNIKDWNDLALDLYYNNTGDRYDIIIVDETQDFSANQMKAVMKHASDTSTVVFVLDAAQRIYPRGWTWREVGITINPQRSYKLKQNHRNTIEICAVARPLLDGLELTDDGTLPDLNSCERHGDIPEIIIGKYSQQIAYVVNRIKNYINLNDESIAFAQPRSGQWFDFLKRELFKNDLNYVELTRQSSWPDGNENIALITMHSAKGLEFDHVFILGLNEELTPHGIEDGDTAMENYRRLLAMTITRARSSVTLGYKKGEASSLFEKLKTDTYNEIIL